jgi:hypothetical protein
MTDAHLLKTMLHQAIITHHRTLQVQKGCSCPTSLKLVLVAQR